MRALDLVNLPRERLMDSLADLVSVFDPVLDSSAPDSLVLQTGAI